MPVIYKFTCKTTSKVYIGQTIQKPEARKNAHGADSFNPNSKSYNCKFYRAIRKYGWEDFDFEVICECEKHQMNDLEAKYVAIYDSYRNGYNETTGGDAPTELSKESNQRRSDTHRKRFNAMDDMQKKQWSEMLKERHRKKPMSEETKEKIRKTLKKNWEKNKKDLLEKRKSTQSTVYTNHVRVRKNKISTTYIIQNHPRCKYKSFSDKRDCDKYLIKLELDAISERLAQIVQNNSEIIEQINNITEMVNNLVKSLFVE